MIYSMRRAFLERAVVGLVYKLMTTQRACQLEKNNAEEYRLIFHGIRIGKYYCKNMKYRI